MLSNQFRSFYGEGILSTNLILYPLYMNKPRQQQMKWEGEKRQVYKILIGKEWGFDEIYPNFFYLPRKMVCRLLLSACRYNNGGLARSS